MHADQNQTSLFKAAFALGLAASLFACGTGEVSVDSDDETYVYENNTDAIAVNGNDSVLTGNSTPGAMTVGETLHVVVQFKNTGTTTWTRASGHRLVIVPASASSIWGVSEVLLGTTTQIAPNGVLDRTAVLHAPARPGVYNIAWQMAKGTTRFGEVSPTVRVSVEPKATVPANTAAFTIAILPDTQGYVQQPSADSTGSGNSAIFQRQTEWIASHVASDRIAFVLHEGDIVQNGDWDNEWRLAKANMRLLDGKVPYSVAFGNHDRSPASTPYGKFNQYFPVSSFSGRPSFGGTYQANQMQNHYMFMDAGGERYLILTLEFSPTDPILTWANEIVSRYSQYPVILLTHMYMNNNNQLLGEGDAYSPPAGRDGDALWQKLVRKHANIRFVFSGHVYGVGRLVAPNDAGQMVTQLLADFQGWGSGGNGFMRLIEFYPDKNYIVVKTYSPYLNQYKTDSRNMFGVDLSTGLYFVPGQPPPPSTSTHAVYRFFWSRNGDGDHMFDTRPTPSSGYLLEGGAFRLFDHAAPGRVPLYQVYSAALVDHMQTTVSDEAWPVYSAPVLLGYCGSAQTSATPRFLRRVYCASATDHFMSANEEELAAVQRDGCVLEGGCWVP